MGKSGKLVLISAFLLFSNISMACNDLKYDKLGWMTVTSNSTDKETFHFLPNFGEIEGIIIASNDSFSSFDIKSVVGHKSNGTEELRFFWDYSYKSYSDAYKDDFSMMSPFDRINKVDVELENDDNFRFKSFDIFATYCED